MATSRSAVERTSAAGDLLSQVTTADKRFERSAAAHQAHPPDR
jgi:hypothetical protein